jgi:hypothetical protein
LSLIYKFQVGVDFLMIIFVSNSKI